VGRKALQERFAEQMQAASGARLEID
jgi:hypothetical protein